MAGEERRLPVKVNEDGTVTIECDDATRKELEAEAKKLKEGESLELKCVVIPIRRNC